MTRTTTTGAAVYARRSVEQKGRAAEAKSVTQQEDDARKFAAERGWIVLDDHVYVDDGISGAEFGESRPGLKRLLDALKPRAPFQALIVSEQKSIGRELSETLFTIKQLAQAGVEVFEYTHGRSLTPKRAMDKVMQAFQSGIDEAHIEQDSERMHRTHTRLARKGYVTGGRLFGYRNVDVFKGTDEHGRPLRSHVERVIEPNEAQMVVRIFSLYASGLGLRAIAHQLNREGAISPRYSPPKDGLPALKAWSASTVRAILMRDIYHGVLVWNKWRKRDDYGQWRPRPRPESEWIRTTVEHLRIVPEDLWDRVVARRRETEGRALRFESGRLAGRPPKHGVVNVLAGLAACGVCGGGMVAETSGPIRSWRLEKGWTFRSVSGSVVRRGRYLGTTRTAGDHPRAHARGRGRTDASSTSAHKLAA